MLTTDNLYNLNSLPLGLQNSQIWEASFYDLWAILSKMAISEFLSEAFREKEVMD